MNQVITIIKAGQQYRPAIINLLQSAQLPVDDVPESIASFFVAVQEDKVVAAIGMERYGDGALLRSLVVDAAYRNLQLASQLIKQLEDAAGNSGISTMYLLTETAPNYFVKKGYQPITRADVPIALQASSEFSHVCPVSAIVMKKALL